LGVTERFTDVAVVVGRGVTVDRKVLLLHRIRPQIERGLFSGSDVLVYTLSVTA
jgi:hypothetical protein